MESPGPNPPELHFDEMSLEELSCALTWLYMAASMASKQGVDRPVQDVLVEWYDEVFAAIAEASDEFRDRFKKGSIVPLGGRAGKPKYRKMIQEASES